MRHRDQLPDGLSWHDEGQGWTPEPAYEECPSKSPELTHLKMQAARFNWTIEPHRKGWAVQMPRNPRYPEVSFCHVVATLDDVRKLIEQATASCERFHTGWIETSGKLTPGEEKPFWKRFFGL